MANTYKALSTVTVGAGGASSIDFTNIPATYTDLVIKISGRSARSAQQVDNLFITFNSNTASYTSRLLIGTGSSVSSTSYSARYASLAVDAAGSTANTFSNHEIYIPNYASSTNKSVSADSVSENNATAANSDLVALLWSNTAPITSVSLSPEVSTWVQYTTATLYGVFNADVSSAPATPTIGTATAGSSSASITFTGVSNAASYTMTSTPGSFTGTGTSSPITVTGLTNGTSYTFKVKANNPFGSSAESAASNSVTPVAPYDVIVGLSGSPSLSAWTFSSGFGTKYADAPGSLSYTAAAVSFAPDKSAILVGIDGTPTAVEAYAWSSSGYGSKFSNPATQPSGRQLGASFKAGNNAVATGGDGSHLNGWPWSSGFGTKYSNPASVPTGGFAVRFDPSGAYIAVSNNSSSPWQAVYNFSSGFGSKFSDPGTTPGGATYGTAWTPSSNAILYTAGSSPYVFAYPWSGSGYGSKYANPATLANGLPGRVTNFNAAGNAWVGGGNSTDMINAYAWSSGFGTKYAAPSGTSSIVGENAFFTPDDSAVIWGGQGDGTTSLMAWAWTNGSGFGTKYSNPPSPTNTRVYGLDVR